MLTMWESVSVTDVISALFQYMKEYFKLNFKLNANRMSLTFISKL